MDTIRRSRENAKMLGVDRLHRAIRQDDTADWHGQSRALPKPVSAQTKPPGLSFRSRRLSLLLPRCYCLLCLNDAGRDEEDQLLVGCADACPFEQIAQVRDISQQRYLRDVD
jgi:hypothetical protein